MRRRALGTPMKRTGAKSANSCPGEPFRRNLVHFRVRMQKANCSLGETNLRGLVYARTHSRGNPVKIRNFKIITPNFATIEFPSPDGTIGRGAPL